MVVPSLSAALTRRSLLRRGSAIATLALIGSTSSGVAFANGRRSVDPYGRLELPDRNGLRLPPGFESRVVARSGDRVADTDYVWHDQPDGGACFASTDGGFVYVSNSELSDELGGVGAIRFDSDGSIVDAYRVLDGTNRNCGGGSTPWGTWLTCEEFGDEGQVYECDPQGLKAAQQLPGLGSFNHEAVVVVPEVEALFLTEDHSEGRLYRFVPSAWPDLNAGQLQAASVATNGSVRWVDVADDEPDRSSNTTAFNGGEGIATWNGEVYVATKGDRRIWHFDPIESVIGVIHDCAEAPNTVLDSVDNLAVDPSTGDLLVAEDGPTQDLAILTLDDDGSLLIAGLVRFEGHEGSEVTGPAFSPDRTTLMLSSQRGTDGRGITYAITGPFRDTEAVPVVPPTTLPPTTTVRTLEEAVGRDGLQRATRLGPPGHP